MVVISRLFAIFTVFLFNGGCLAGEVANPMSISIHARDVIVKTGDAVTLEAVITNVSATKISLVTLRHDAGGSRSGTDFDMKVIGPGGELRPLHHFSRGSFGFVNLSPGDERKEEIILSDEFDMAGLGKYVISIAPFISSKDGFDAQTWSNTITVTVTQ